MFRSISQTALFQKATRMTSVATTALHSRFWPALKSLHRLPSAVIYGISVFTEKAVSLIMLPVVAAFIAPADYGVYDVAVSVIEGISLIMSMAISAVVIRFASTAATDGDKASATAELLGSALTIAACALIPVAAFSPYILIWLGLDVSPAAFRMLTVAAVFTSMTQLTMVWVRICDRASTFLLLVVIRTVAQVSMTVTVLMLGFGIDGIIAGNGVVLTCFAAAMLAVQIKDTGITFARIGFARILTYGLPIVGSMLAMYALGNLNRFALPGVVSPEVIAHFGLASRLALIVWLLLYPFELWWQPRRIACLNEPGGLDLSARMWGLGIGLLLFASLGMALFGPVLVLTILPEAYAPALAYLPPLIMTQIVHHLVQLTNVGTYARDDGYAVLAIDLTGAAVAVLGYIFVVPQIGIAGVIASMILGNLTRLTLHVAIGYSRAPVAYPWQAACLTFAAGAALVLLAPSLDMPILRTAYTAIAAAVLVGVMVATRLVILPPGGFRYGRG